MNSLRRRTILAVAAVLSLALAAQGQQRSSRIGFVYPAGGRQGSAFRVVIGGQFLDGASGVLVSGEGVQATVIEHAKPLSGKDFQLLRDKLKELLEKQQAATGSVQAGRTLERLKAGPSGAGKAAAKDKPDAASKPAVTDEGAKAAAKDKPDAASKPAVTDEGAKAAATTKPTWTDADEKALAEVRKKLMNAPNRQGNPAISETVFVEVKIAPDAAPGRRELRLATTLGLTCPMA
ncbi:MAG: hypothetical protein WCI75_21125, partial [candidate division NC10 bacterium]